jgi:hypothetical protein
MVVVGDSSLWLLRELPGGSVSGQGCRDLIALLLCINHTRHENPRDNDNASPSPSDSCHPTGIATPLTPTIAVVIIKRASRTGLISFHENDRQAPPKLACVVRTPSTTALPPALRP